jgi:predicted phosphodiesterase
MKLKYISDIHLEFYTPEKADEIIKQIRAEDEDEVLILAGDIGSPYKETYDRLMKHVAANFKKTFVIAGNHEYYGGKNMEDTLDYMNKYFESYENITFLDNTWETYEGYTFVGSTLWSKVTNPQYKINDIRAIKNMTVDLYNELNQVCIDFLKETLGTFTKNVIIITHHMPSESLIDPKYLEDDLKQYNQWFYSDMDNFIFENTYSIVCWIYGHTHAASTSSMYSVSMLCNPMGYPGENSVVNFQKVFDSSHLKLFNTNKYK